MVRFNDEIAADVIAAGYSFNPTMVRFNVNRLPVLKQMRITFQSHNGSIQRFLFVATGDALDNVSIPQWFDSTFSPSTSWRLFMRGFNPTMVRFNVLHIDSAETTTVKFQ